MSTHRGGFHVPLWPWCFPAGAIEHRSNKNRNATRPHPTGDPWIWLSRKRSLLVSRPPFPTTPWHPAARKPTAPGCARVHAVLNEGTKLMWFAVTALAVSVMISVKLRPTRLCPECLPMQLTMHFTCQQAHGHDQGNDSMPPV